ncbi:MAG: hypothetical protein PHX04_06270 [Bacilli bacterium]|nr:hypothetical protein [Bacilli bacterium]
MAKVGRPKGSKNKPLNRIKKDKEMFLERYSASLNISKAIEGICSRKTIYNWLENDTEFNEKFYEIKEGVIDNAESQLLNLINKGNFWAIKYYLTSHASNRGYKEDVNIRSEPITISYIVPEGSDEK